ncbi:MULTISPECIES: hypothetical protein [Sphingomonas]|uniref:hypothetical protein n=1 Tax=Sphingomonas TaxID=13687 RepID=UPI00126A3443|nr:MULTISPECIES: hypothetical protein [Sphingomonas]
MRLTEDEEYYRQRVIIERQRATDAPNLKIAKVHMQLADLYEELVESREDATVICWPGTSRGHNDNR